MTQYFDNEEGIVCKLIALKECSICASSDALLNILDQEILSQDFSKNLIALVTDGANVMKGQNNSVLSKIKDSHPNIWYLHCICHCLHLVASHASETIPTFVLKFVKNVYKHFCNSPKRVAQFEEIMKTMNVKIKKILRAGKTRWLSLEAAIKRILELWVPLLNYFKAIKDTNRTQDFENIELKVYLQFLAVFLGKINQINIYFQREASEILNVKNELFKVFVNLSNHIFKQFILIENDTVPLDPQMKFNLDLEQDLTNYLLSSFELYQHFIDVFGDVIHLDSVDEITKEKLCRTFQQFILQVLKELKYYLPFNDNILSRISTLDPFFSTMDDWTILAKSFKNIIQPEIFHKFYDEASNWIMDINKLKAHKPLYYTPKF